jgi:hypothetical protein
MDAEGVRLRFRDSPFIERAWPKRLRERTDRYFKYEAIIDNIFFHEYGRPTLLSRTIEPLHELLTETELETLPMWLLGTYADHLAVVDRAGRQELRIESTPLLGARALSRRNFAQAARFFSLTKKSSDSSAFLHAYATAMAGHPERAAAAVRDQERPNHPNWEERGPWPWLVETFEIDDGASSEALAPAEAAAQGGS